MTPIDDPTLIAESSDRARRLRDEDAEWRASLASSEAIARLEGVGSSVEIIARAFDLYRERPAIAYRAPGETIFSTMTYGELWERIARLATGWQREQLVGAGDCVAIVAFGGPEFLIAEVATVYTGATALPLQTNLPPAVLARALNETRARAVVCDADQIAAVAAVLDDCPSVRAVIALAGADPGVIATTSGRGVVRTTLRAVEARGAGAVAPIALPSRGTNPIRTVVYTSGSTGTPKGAVFPETAYVQKWLPGRARTYPFLPDFQLPLPISFVFSPLGHQMGNELLAASLMRGGLAYLAVNGDTSQLFDDFRAARPSFIGLVPRVANQIFEDAKLEVGRRTGWSADAATIARAGAEVMGEMRRSYLGDRLLAMTSASAPITPDVLDFLRTCFRVPVYNLMGMTEVGGFMFDGHIRHDNVIDFRLVDAPELGFGAHDRPHPRGELHLRTRRQVSGYWNDDEATRATFTPDGYVRTGDIFEQSGPETLRWIARKTQVFKLAHGKFVNLSQLETAFVEDGVFVRQAFLYGNSERAFLLAVLVPDVAAVHERLGADAAANPERLRALLRDDLTRVARTHALAPWEVPRDFVVELEPFSRANGLVADNNKLSPARLKEKYAARLEALYAKLEEQRAGQLRAVRDVPSDASVAEKLRRALGAIIDLTVDDRTLGDSTFTALGGDSINAVTLSALLENEFGLRLPVALILNRTSTIADLLRHLLAAASDRPTAARAHGSGDRLRADDFEIDRWLPAREKPTGARPGHGPRVVLLTGANGFLGRFVLLDLLQRAPDEIAHVACVVRARDDAGARARLAAGFATDPKLLRVFEQLARGGRLSVFAGDLIRAELGLPRAIYDALAGEVDTLVHAGALVNHALPYDALFEPNVLGTVEIARLALRGRPKSLAFVSTVGLAEGLDVPLRETETARAIWPERARRSSAPGHGYATSKWAGEVLLEQLSARDAVPVSIFRCSNLMAHARYRGQINADDFLCRLLAGLIYTRVAPPSFFADPDRPASFDGVPVDFAAGAVVDLALRADGAPRPRIFHVVAPERAGGLSLDGMRSAVEIHGYPLVRTPDHGTWFRTFSERLQRLNGDRRRHSPLPIVSRWRTPLPSGSRLDASVFQQALAEIRGSALAQCPALTEDYVHKCLDDLQFLGVI